MPFIPIRYRDLWQLRRPLSGIEQHYRHHVGTTGSGSNSPERRSDPVKCRREFNRDAGLVASNPG
jgi:hypothetical protein